MHHRYIGGKKLTNDTNASTCANTTADILMNVVLFNTLFAWTFSSIKQTDEL